MYISFASPVFLWFLAFIPLLAAVHFYSLHFARQKAMRFANYEALEKILASKSIVPNNYLLLGMRVLALIAFTLAAAGITLHYEITAPAQDFVVAIDTSASMLATDLTPNRMAATTSAVTGWLSTLPSGSVVGLVSFSSQASALVAPTNDLGAVSRAAGSIVPDRSGGTAICEAVKASTNLLLPSTHPRAVVLISDGQNNAGCLLEDGITYARENNATVYAIGVGSSTGAGIDGVRDIIFTPDDKGLSQLAGETGGAYVRAQTPQDLASALSGLAKPVQRMEDVPIATYVMLIAFLLVFADWGLSVTRYRVIP